MHFPPISQISRIGVISGNYINYICKNLRRQEIRLRQGVRAPTLKLQRKRSDTSAGEKTNSPIRSEVPQSLRQDDRFAAGKINNSRRHISARTTTYNHVHLMLQVIINFF